MGRGCLFGLCSHSRTRTRTQTASCSLTHTHTHTRTNCLSRSLSHTHMHSHTHLPLGGKRQEVAVGSSSEQAYLITCTNIGTQFNILPDTPPHALRAESFAGTYNFFTATTSNHTGLMWFPTSVWACKGDHALFQGEYSSAWEVHSLWHEASCLMFVWVSRLLNCNVNEVHSLMRMLGF